MPILKQILLSALFVTLAIGCGASKTGQMTTPEPGAMAGPAAKRGPAAKSLPAAKSGPAAKRPSPKAVTQPPDALLESLRHLASTSARFRGQQARIIFGCSHQGTYVCIAPAGVLGPKTTARIVQALGKATFDRAGGRAVNFLCAKSDGRWTCRSSFGKLPATYAKKPHVIGK